MKVNRLRIIAGPNGSGKTTLYFFLKNKILTGIWLNADEILDQFKRKGFIEYALLGFRPSQNAFNKFCNKKSSITFINTFNLNSSIKNLHFAEFSITYTNKSLSNELAAFLTDFFRYFLLSINSSITTETVLSHQSKLDFVQQAKRKKYKTYLYFIATSSPEINIRRIKGRMYKGGHSVPAGKIKSRFLKSINILGKSISIFDRVYIFDNSGNDIQLIASYENAQLEKIYTTKIPLWLNFLLNKKDE